MITVEHSNELKAQLLALPEKIRKSIERKAIAETNSVLVASLKANAPADSGALQKSMKSVIRTYKSGRIMVGVSGPDDDYSGYVIKKPAGKIFKKTKQTNGKRNYRRPANYAHLVDRGTKDRITKDGRRTGAVQGIQFLEKVIAAHKNLFVQNVTTAVNEALQ
jgi:HK97 gp10 family phage protein